MKKQNHASTLAAINMLEELGSLLESYQSMTPKHAVSLLKELLTQPTTIISTDKEKSEYVEILHEYLKHYRKLFPSKVAVARFAKEYELSSLSEKTLAQGVPFRIVFEAFDASTENLKRAVAHLQSLDTPTHQVASATESGKRKKLKTQTQKSDWGNTIRELFNPESET